MIFHPSLAIYLHKYLVYFSYFLSCTSMHCYSLNIHSERSNNEVSVIESQRLRLLSALNTQTILWIFMMSLKGDIFNMSI